MNLLASKDPIAFAQINSSVTESRSNGILDEPGERYRTDEELAEEFLRQQGINPNSREGEDLVGYERDAFGEVGAGQF